MYATYETSGNLEDKKRHKMIDNLNPDLRVSSNREFFVMSPQEAYDLLEAIAVISGTKNKLKRKATDTKIVKQNIKKPPINFAECEIPIGAELAFIEDPSVKVTVVSERKVQWNEEITSLSAVAATIKGVKSIQGPSYFTYNGRPIVDIAMETQWKDYK